MPVVLETSVDGVVRQHAGEPDDDQFLTLVIGSILAGENPESVLRPLLRGYLISRRRAIVRAVEKDVFAAAFPGGGGAESAAEANVVISDRLRPLLTELVYIPGHGKIPWGQATVPMLESRIAMYRRQQDAIGRSVSRVEAMISLIQSVPGATCLADVIAASPSI